MMSVRVRDSVRVKVSVIVMIEGPTTLVFTFVLFRFGLQR